MIAFLNSELDYSIYIEKPKVVRVNDETRLIQICKLKKALFGLKISPKRWNKRVTEEVRKLGLENTGHVRG